MIDYNEINDFIIKVFNYYNGKINVINKAVLDINWANLFNCENAGYSRLPNIVVINPMVIIRFYNNDEIAIKVSIIETIIHELYHTDQLINYNLYSSDVNYNRFIENACEVQTTIYISGHIHELKDLIQYDNFSIKPEAFINRMKYFDLVGIKYQRRYYYDHIFMCIDELCNLGKHIGQKLYEFIKYNIQEKNDIILTINNDIINVCLYGDIIPIDQFNNIMVKYSCTGIYDVSHNILYDKDTNILDMNIQVQIKNLMCKKV